MFGGKHGYNIDHNHCLRIQFSIFGSKELFSLSIYMFGGKHGYNIDHNQEVIAQSASNIFGGFFSSFPKASFLTRSLVQEDSGGKRVISGWDGIVWISELVYYIIFSSIGALEMAMSVCWYVSLSVG